jgi:hypothetical protein
MSENWKHIISIVTAIAGTVAIIRFFDEKKTRRLESDIKKIDLELKKHEYEQKLGKPSDSFLGFDGTYLY